MLIYEDQLGDALEGLLGDGADDLSAIAAGLNERNFKSPSAEPWTAETLAAELSRLAARTGAWGSGGILRPNKDRPSVANGRQPGLVPSSADILKTGLLNHWYLVCRASEIDAKPIRLTRLGRDIALWRDGKGKIHAIEDYCPHRGARMSAGHVVNDALACAYHGVTLDGTGVVVGVPPVLNCPMLGRKLVEAYPAHEFGGAIFLYFSDGIDGNVPAFEPPEEMTSPEWSGFLFSEEWDCNYRLPLDNRLDPIHGSYLHTDTFTLSYGVKQSAIKLEQKDNGFIIERDNQRGINIDRTWVEYRPGNNYWIRTEIPYPKKAGGGMFRILGHVTPIDEHHTYFWVFRCKKSVGWRRDLWRFLYQNRLEKRHDDVAAQDRAIMEGIPNHLADREMLIQTDVGIGRIRMIYRREAERQAERLAEHARLNAKEARASQVRVSTAS